MAQQHYSAKNRLINFEDEWPKVRPVLLKLLHQLPVNKQEWQDLFWTVHQIYSWADKSFAKIADALQTEISDYVKRAQLRISSNQEEYSLLKAYVTEWQKYYSQSLYLPEPFRSLESATHGSRSPQTNQKSCVALKPSRAYQEESFVRKIMLETWNKIIFCNIKERLQAAAMRLVFLERSGEAFDAQLVVGVRESFVSLCADVSDRLVIYRQHFEKAYMNSTDEFYRTRAAKFLRENGVIMYMRYAEQKLGEEEQRGMRYLEIGHNSNSLQLLMDRCVTVLVTAFEEHILGECPSLIKRNEIDRLRLMYRLLNRTPTGLDPVLKDLEEHIKNQGLADMVANAENIVTDPERYVEQLLGMFRRFSSLVHDAFLDDPRFLTARDKAFQDIVNDITVFKIELPAHQRSYCSKLLPESKCPELLANYCDLLLRKTQISRKLTSDEIDAKLADVLLVLKYVQNKDVFMRFHKAHMARRLILDVSTDQEKEESMVNRLREAGMPADYINKLYRMLQDIEINKDLNKYFKSTYSFSNNNKNAISDMVNIKILNAGAWARTVERLPVSLPRELEDFIPEVEEFYRSQHSGRRLQWLHHWSNGVISFVNLQGHYELEVTTFQMSVLFCWNDRPNDKISFENLHLATELPNVELRKTLWALLNAPKLKHQIILCDCSSRNPKDFTDSTLFWVNQNFTLVKSGKVQTRGRINLIGRLQLSLEQVKEHEHNEVVQLRILRVQEAIVKIMKMRKRLSNAQLQTELVEMLKHMFLPSRKLIKEQIEWLLEHRYLTRDSKDFNIFIYLS